MDACESGVGLRHEQRLAGVNSSIKLIVFDLGHVLVRTCNGWQHACEVAGLPYRLPPREQLIKGPLHDAVCEMEIGQIDTNEFCRRTGAVLEIDPRHVRTILDVYLLSAFPGVHELLDELNSAGYVTACLSNTNLEHWEQMLDPTDRAALPMDRIRHHFASHELRLRKPDEAIYRHVERTTGFAGPQIIFFDDLPENIEGACRVSWHAHQIARGQDPIAQIRGHLARADVLRDSGASGAL